MTEEQAKTKWCPFARQYLSHTDASANRGFDGVPIGECIGSACMAWRWSMVIESGGDLVAPVLRKSDTEGRCGLAGGE